MCLRKAWGTCADRGDSLDYSLTTSEASSLRKEAAEKTCVLTRLSFLTRSRYERGAFYV